MTEEERDNAYLAKPEHEGDAVLLAAAAGIRCGLAPTLPRALEMLRRELDAAAFTAVAEGTPLLLADRLRLSEKARHHREALLRGAA